MSYVWNLPTKVLFGAGKVKELCKEQMPGKKALLVISGGTGGGRPLTEKPLPYIEITTSAGTGSKVDCWGAVTNPDIHEKIGFQGGYPVLAIVDPELMVTVPPTFTAYQGFDALFHSVEVYVSKFCNEAAEMVEMAVIRWKYAPVPASTQWNTLFPAIIRNFPTAQD